MTAMPNLHIRDVPLDALATFRSSAEGRGRSLNSELVAALVAEARRIERAETLRARFAEGHRRFREAYPDGYPRGLEPETIIRRDRDAR